MSQLLTFLFWKSLKTVLLPVLFLAGAQLLAGPVPAGVPAGAGAMMTNAPSVFIMPASSKEGRDPFYPASIRPYQAEIPPGGKVPDLNLDSLVMQGISGAPPHRLAIINKHTFAAGDYGEVSTSQGRIHIHCLEINASSAVIEVNGQRHELRYEEKP
jgi:hypothetical protein